MARKTTKRKATKKVARKTTKKPASTKPKRAKAEAETVAVLPRAMDLLRAWSSSRYSKR